LWNRATLIVLMVVLLILGLMSPRVLGANPAASLRPEATTGSKQQIPVLLYHDLKPGAGSENGAIVSVEEFAAQMQWLHDHGYTTISTDDLFRWLQGETELPPRSVLITFDDGYESMYQYAYPILKRYGFQAVVFMVTGLSGQRTGSLSYLSWEQMQEMEASGLVEIQGHTHDGHRLVDGVPVLTTWPAGEIRSDLERLNRSLTLHGLRPVTAFAYPYGVYDADVIEVLKAAGLKLAFTTQHGYVSKDADSYTLNRVIVFPGTDLCQFARLVDPEGSTVASTCHGV